MFYHYIGIDPGVKGGITILTSGDDIQIFKMPQTCQGLLKILELKGPKVHKVYTATERLWPRRQRSATSTFRMGLEAGSCEMALNAMRFMHRKTYTNPKIVSPQVWQKKIGAPPRPKDLPSNKAYSQHKKNLWHYAQSLFPSEKILKDTADSVLIAYYLRQEHQSGNLQ